MILPYRKSRFRKAFLLAGMLLLGTAALCQQDSTAPEKQIRLYWFVLLTSGPHRDQDKATAARIQEGHLANIRRLHAEGLLKVAGPFADEGNWQGIFIFDVPDRKELEKILQTDPAIAAGRLNYEIHSWYTLATGSFKPGKPEQQ
jgi:uncharacterized protein YciI